MSIPARAVTAATDDVDERERGTERPTPPPRARRGVVIAASIACLALIGGIGILVAWAHTARPATPATPRITVTGAYLPEPASPGVAAAYAILHNTGDAADQLTAVETDPPATASLHQDVVRGATGTMVMLTALTIPAHGTATLAPNGDHIMILGLADRRPGQTVRLTLVFAASPPVTVQALVVPLGQTGPTP